MNIQNKKVLVVCVILAMGIGILTMSHGMKRLREESQDEKLFAPVELEGVVELKKRMENTAVYFMLKDAVEYLNSGKPIKLESHGDEESGELVSEKIAAGKLLMSAERAVIEVWDLWNKKLQHRLATPGAEMTVEVLHDQVIIGLDKGIMQAWDINTGKLLRTFQLGWSESLQKLDIWDVTNKHIGLPEGYVPFGSYIALHGNKAVVGEYNLPVACVLNMSGNIPVPLHVLNHDAADGGWNLAIDDKRVITARNDVRDKVKVWDIHTGNLLHQTWTDGGGSIRKISDTYVLIKNVQGHNNPIYTLYDAVTGMLLKSFEARWRDGVWLGKRYLFHCVDSEENPRIELIDIRKDEKTSIPTQLANEFNLAAGDTLIFDSENDKSYYVWPFALLLDGTVENNPLLWITKISLESKNGMLQAHFIKRAYEATIAKQDLIIDMPQSLSTPQEGETQEQRDGRTYFSFPAHVRQYLRDRLNIRKEKKPSYFDMIYNALMS